MKYCGYSRLLFPFADYLKLHFHIDDLQKLHTLNGLHKSITDNAIVQPGRDSQSSVHRIFYEIGKPFYDLYKRFIRNEVLPQLTENNLIPDGNVLYQKVPSFRLHAPGNKAVGAYHRDSDYNHPDGEINIWLPFTPAFDTNSMFVAQDEYIKPIELEYGQYLIFDGRNILHGNEINQTGVSRVSIDFRILHKSKYIESDAASVQHNVKFKLGHYYEDLWT